MTEPTYFDHYLAELKERATTRAAKMVDYPDSEEELAERAELSEALQRLQMQTEAWNND